MHSVSGTDAKDTAPAAAFPVIVCAGDILTDMVRQTGANWLAQPGGAGWNVARATAALGVKTAFAGAIGRDCFSDALWHASETAGLDLRFLQRVDAPPLLAVVHQANPPDYFFIGEGSADLRFDPARLPSGWTHAVSWVCFGGISLAREPLAAALLDLAKHLRATGKRIAFDPNHRKAMGASYWPTFVDMCALADLIKVSDEDLQALFQVDEDTALQRLRALNPAATIVVTRGAGRVSVMVGEAEGEAVHEAWPPVVEVVDTIGAGDAVMGALLALAVTAPEQSWPARLAFALAAGAAACQHAGAYSPSRDDIEAVIDSMRLSE